MGAGVVILFIIAAVIYFIPAIVASQRNATNRVGIFWLTLLGGWTVIGWLAAFIWACVDSKGDTLPESAEEGFNIILERGSAKPGPAWARMVAGLPVKLVTEAGDGEETCTVESELGTVATFKDQDLIKRIAFRTETQGKPRAKVYIVSYDGGERFIHIGIRFPEARSA